MTYVYEYKDALRQCRTLLTESFIKLLEYLKREDTSFPAEPNKRGVCLTIKKRLDAVLEDVALLKSAYDGLTQHNHCLDSFDDKSAEKFYKYLKQQEALRLKFIRVIDECKRIKTCLDNILDNCSIEVFELDENCIQNLSKCSDDATNRSFSNKTVKFDISPVPKTCTSAQKLDLDDELGSKRNKSSEFSSTGSNNGSVVRKRVLPSSKRNKSSCIEQSIVCTICNTTFTRRDSLARHMLLHEGLKPYKCTECDKSFRRKDHQKKHMRLIHHTYYYSGAGGDVIKKSNPTTSLRTKEVKKLDSRKLNRGQTFGCNICGRIFKRKGTLGRHTLIHDGEKGFERAECGKLFARKDHRRNHILEMKRKYVQNLKNIEGFSCSICGKVFPKKINKRLHERTAHVEEKLHCCVKCGKRYKYLTSLRKHLRLRQCSLE